MKKHLSARTRALVRACLDNDSEEENNTDEDVIENSPPSPIPIHLKPDLFGFARNTHQLNGSNAVNDEKDALSSVDSSAKNYESPSPAFSPLTPKPPGQEYSGSSKVLEKDALSYVACSTKGLESPSPAFSPLTPKPPVQEYSGSSKVLEKDALSYVACSTKGLESPSPAFFPITAKALCAQELNEPNATLEKDALSGSSSLPVLSSITPKSPCVQEPLSITESFVESPLPQMSPETLKLFNTLSSTLTNELDFNFDGDNEVNNTNLAVTTGSEDCLPLIKSNLQLDNSHADVFGVTNNNAASSMFDSSMLAGDRIKKQAMKQTHRDSSGPSSSSSTTSIASPLLETESFDSDDSIKDPDYDDKNNNDSSSDDNSNQSISILTTHADDCETLSTTASSSVPLISHTISSSVSNDNYQQQEILEDCNFRGRPKKGRKRKYGELSRDERKIRKYNNLSYVNYKKELINPKSFIDFKCICKKKCHDIITVEKRTSEFKKFYQLGSYNAQNMFIAACVVEQPVKGSYVTTNKTTISKKKQFSRNYFLNNISVCKEMFLKTLQISSKRVNKSLHKMRSETCIKDRRGFNAGKNKISQERELFLINIIKKLPTYISHYGREGTDAKFLSPDMTFAKIYKLYCDEAVSVSVRPVSFSKAKQVFLTRFNLRTKPLKKDTCNKCDYFAIQKTNASDEQIAKIEENHNEHLRKAKSLQKQLKMDMKLAQENAFVETMSFDLQKTLPLPRIPTNIVFYKRQLWVYNLGIHTGSNDQAHCNVWVEGEAGRGSQEVGSCLLKHVFERLKINVKHLILWSDSCGGQNRNIKLTLMLKAMLHDHPTLEQVSMRFLESGHSFLPNDTDFGKIECALKLQQRLYTPEDYINIMKNCKKTKPMQVHKMQKEDFLSSAKLEKLVTNRKKSVHGTKVSWLNTKEILLKKKEMFNLYMRSDLEKDFIVVNLQKSLRGNSAVLKRDIMEPLWPHGKPISLAKLNDIKSLLHLIPKDAHPFYKNLTGNESIIDDVDGFSGEPDFEIERDDVTE